MDETVLMNQVKEDLCYCSLDYLTELKSTRVDRRSREKKRSALLRHWVLPDYVSNMRGYVKEESMESQIQTEEKAEEEDFQVLKMELERIAVPGKVENQRIIQRDFGLIVSTISNF